MEFKEIFHISIAFIILTIVISFSNLLNGNWIYLGEAAVYSLIILFIAIAAKKFTAFLLDADVEHEIWPMSRWGIKPHHHIEGEAPMGAIVPLILSLFSLGLFKLPAILSYETRALKHRAAKKFGLTSFTEMTDWHNGLVGAGGIIGIVILSVIAYLLDYEILSKLSAYYALANIIPFSKLDGTQIFFGSRVLYSILAVVVLILFIYALLI